MIFFILDFILNFLAILIIIATYLYIILGFIFIFSNEKRS